jgi:hypothetical protein
MVRNVVLVELKPHADLATQGAARRTLRARGARAVRDPGWLSGNE